MDKSGYIVIGGQYEYYTYGVYKTLLAAKRAANKHAEYWDNWQGWHVPNIYRAEDCEPIHNFFGDGYAPVEYARPIDWKTGQPFKYKYEY